LPVVGKQFAQPSDGVHRDAREHIMEPREWLDAAPLAGSDEASQHGCGFAALVAAEKGPVAAAVMLGRLGGKKGGKARMASLTEEQRSALARKAAQTRWRKKQATGE
jgi:hypothetical protein